MNDITAQWVIPIITNLIAGAMMYAIGKWFSRTTISMDTVKGVANSAAKKTTLIALELGQYTFIFWFLITQLRALCEPESPPTRVDSLMISFWTVILLLVFFRLLSGAPIFKRME